MKTRTRDELRRMLIERVMHYLLEEDMNMEDAINRATADISTQIHTEWATEMAKLMREAGVRPL